MVILTFFGQNHANVLYLQKCDLSCENNTNSCQYLFERFACTLSTVQECRDYPLKKTCSSLNGWGQPFIIKKINRFKQLGYLFWKNIRLFEQLLLAIEKNLHLFEWLGLSIRKKIFSLLNSYPFRKRNEWLSWSIQKRLKTFPAI